MARNMNKVSRKQRRAEDEINIVRLCQERLIDKQEEVAREIDAKSQQLDILDEKGRLSTNSRAQINIAREMQSISRSIATKDRDYEVYQDFVFLFDDLLDRLDSLYRNGRFKYIIKIIPEKRLPSMVLDPNKITLLTNLVETLIQECDGAIAKFQIAFAATKNNIEKMAGMQKTLDEKYRKLDNGIDEIVARWQNGNNNEEVATAETPKYNLNRK